MKLFYIIITLCPCEKIRRGGEQITTEYTGEAKLEIQPPSFYEVNSFLFTLIL